MKNIKTNLEFREIKRGQDIDYFIESMSYPVIIKLSSDLTSEIQFPKSRAVLVRTSPVTSKVTIHIMRDIDLHSSFANFEVDLKNGYLNIYKKRSEQGINFIDLSLILI